MSISSQNFILTKLIRINLRLVQSASAKFANISKKKVKISSSHDLLKAKMMSNFIDKKSHILDIGCGNGRRLLDLSLFVDGLYGKGIELFKSNFPEYPIDNYINFSLEIFDGKTIPFEDNSYDISNICYVLHHLKTDHARELINEAIRVTKKRIIILEDSMPEFSLSYKVRNWCHATEANLEYESKSKDFVKNFNHSMFKNHKEWVNFFNSFDHVKNVQIVPLTKISNYEHHTLFVIELEKKEDK